MDATTFAVPPDGNAPSAVSGAYQRPPAAFSGQVPPRIAFALNYIALCNNGMGLRFRNDEGEVGYVEQKLHPAQEAAFNLACHAVGNYMVGLEPNLAKINPELLQIQKGTTDVGRERRQSIDFGGN